LLQGLQVNHQIAIRKYRSEMTHKANDLLDNIVASVPSDPKWAYCAGGELDTQIVAYDFPKVTRYYFPKNRDIQNVYSNYSNEPALEVDDLFYVCDVKKVLRFVTHTIKEKHLCYDITFADKAVVLICDPLRAPKEVPRIYEMCWYGREIHNINQYTKTSVDACNIPQKDGK